jgi:hypothetical protein
MKKLFVIIITGLTCLMLMAAGCTSNSDTTPATPAATTAVPEPSLTASTTTVAAETSPAAEAKSWSGLWSTTWNSADNATLVAGDDITFTQTGSSVIGTYTNPTENFTGSITGTVMENTLTGTWLENGTPVTTGPLEFVLSADGNAFTGTWSSTPANATVTSNVTYLWNGVRK